MNFQRTTKGYSADVSHDSGLGFQRLYFSRVDVSSIAELHGWPNPDARVPEAFGGTTVAEYFIAHGMVEPYRVSRII